MPSNHGRSRSLNSTGISSQTSGFSRTSRELAQNIAVQCLSPTLPRDIPPELLERSRKLAEDQRRIIADRADSRKLDSDRSSGRSAHTSPAETTAERGDDDKSDHSGDNDSDHERSADRDSADRAPALSHPNSPKTRQQEPHSAPPYPVFLQHETLFEQQTRHRPHRPERRQTIPRHTAHSGPRSGPPPVHYSWQRYVPQLPPRHAPHTAAPYHMRKGPQRRFGSGGYAAGSPYTIPAAGQPPHPTPAMSTPLFNRPDLMRRVESLESMVGDLTQQVSELQQSNRKLLDAQLQQSQLVSLYGLAQSGTLSPGQFSKFMATATSRTAELSSVVTPVSSEPSRTSAPSSGHSSRSRASSTDLQSEIYDIIQREQQASDRARGLRLGPNEVPPEEELMPSPRLHPPPDWGRMDRSKAPPSETKAVSTNDKSIPLAGRRCGRFFSLNLNALRQSSQPAKTSSAFGNVKEESAEPDYYMPDVEDSDDYDEPAESALTPETESCSDAPTKAETAKPPAVPPQFMSMCTKMWHVLET